MQLNRRIDLPIEFIDAQDYDDPVGMLQAVARHAGTCIWRKAGLVAEAAASFPALANAQVGYIEVSEEDIDKMGLTENDARHLKGVLLRFEAGALATELPLLIVPPKRLDLMERDAQLRVLTHELVHIEQAVRGSLKFVRSGGQWWEGELYKEDIATITQGLNVQDPIARVLYLQMPWEREAIQRSEGLKVYASKLQQAWAILIAFRQCCDEDQRPHIAGAILELLEHATNAQGIEKGPHQEDIDTLVSLLTQMGHEAVPRQASYLHSVIERLSGFTLPSPLNARQFEIGLYEAAAAMIKKA